MYGLAIFVAICAGWLSIALFSERFGFFMVGLCWGIALGLTYNWLRIESKKGDG